MPFDIKLLNPGGFELDIDVLAGFPTNIPPHRIVPLRFARAVHGVVADSAAPDLDDHGFTICPGGAAHGPTVGVVSGQTIRIRVVRDRLDDPVDLVPSMDDESIAKIVFPDPGDPLSAQDTPADANGVVHQGDCVFVQGPAGAKQTKSTKLFIHHGKASGPVMAEMAIFVYPLLIIPVRLHSVVVRGTPPDFSEAQVKGLFTRVNRVYAQAGIRFTFPSTMQTTPFDSSPLAAGTIDVDANFDAIFDSDNDPDMLNVYFCHSFTDPEVMGAGDNKVSSPGSRTGFFFRTDQPDLSQLEGTIAHELGHTLRLDHYNLGDPPNVREDIWAHRNLMHNSVNLAEDPSQSPGNHFLPSEARSHVGYGLFPDTSPRAGTVLMTKQRSVIAQSNQIPLVRQTVVAGQFKP